MQLAKDLAAGGFATLLIAIGVAGWYKVWIWGYVYEDMKKEKDAQIESERQQKNEYKSMLFSARNLTDRTVEVAQKALGGQ